MDEILSRILAYTLIVATIVAAAVYIYYMIICTKVELKKLEKK